MDENNVYISRLFSLIPNLSCRAIAKRMTDYGYAISPSSVERLKRNTRDLTLRELLAFCKVFDLKPNEIFTKSPKEEGFNQNKVFINDPDTDAFQGYLGEYNCYFYSTAIEEQGKWIKGKLSLNKAEALSGKYCRASVLLYVNTPKIKIFEGHAFISVRKQGMWIQLVEKRTSDFVTIVFHYRPFIGECDCRLGAVLTMGAGDSMQPVFHKILLTRKNFTETQLAKLIPVLKIGISQIRLSEETWKNWADTNHQYVKYVPIREEHTYVANMHTVFEETDIPTEAIVELLELAQNDSVNRLRRIEDRFTYLLQKNIKEGML